MSSHTTRKTGPERREEIALAALRIVGERGSTGLTIAALAQAVGLTSGALFRHYASRDAMLIGAVELAARRVEATFPVEGLAPLAGLRALAQARVALLREEPAIEWLLRSTQARATLPAVAVERLAELIARSRRFIKEALRAGVEAGEIRDDVSPDVLMLVFTASVHALIGGGRSVGTRPPAEEPRAKVDEVLRLITTPSQHSKRS